jgi:hypothetical protein
MSKLEEYLTKNVNHSIRIEFLSDNLWYAALVDENQDVVDAGPHEWPMIASHMFMTTALALLDQMMENYA